MRIWVAICIAITIFQTEAPEAAAESQSQNPVVYDYYYYYDEYYDDPATTTPAKAPPAPPRKSVPKADESGEVLDYDLKELVKAWKEYMQEKKKEKEEEEEVQVRPVRPTGIRAGSGQRGGSGSRVRLQGTGLRGGSGSRVRLQGTGQRGGGGGRFSSPRNPQNTGFRNRGTGVRRRPSGLRNGGSGQRGTAFRGGAAVSGPRGTGTRLRRPSAPRVTNPPALDLSAIRGLGSVAAGAPEYDYYEIDAAEVLGSRRPQVPQYEEYECEPQDQSYNTPDLAQCDKYYECNIKGELKEKLCPDGLVYEIASQNCDYPAKVNCSGRPDLQPAQESKNCPRANGFFAWPAEESCQKFWDCRGGTAYLQECPVGVIFDPKIDACVTPDQSARPECAAGKVLGFECPTYGEEEALTFGNHDRLPSPKNCQEFFTCLRTGQPRLGVCPKKTVFNSDTGHCDDPANVKGCENYWKEKEKEELLDYYDY